MSIFKAKIDSFLTGKGVKGLWGDIGYKVEVVRFLISEGVKGYGDKAGEWDWEVKIDQPRLNDEVDSIRRLA